MTEESPPVAGLRLDDLARVENAGDIVGGDIVCFRSLFHGQDRERMMFQGRAGGCAFR